MEFNDPLPEVGKPFGVITIEGSRREHILVTRILGLDWLEIEGKEYLLVRVTCRVKESEPVDDEGDIVSEEL